MTHLKTFLIAAVCVMVIGPAGCKKEKPSPNADTVSGDQVKEETAEALDTTGAYLSQQRDTLMEKAGQVYEELEADTQQLITDLKASGKESWQELSSNLDSQLAAAREKLDALKQAGDKNYQQAKDAFDATVDELQQAYENAKRRMQDQTTE